MFQLSYLEKIELYSGERVSRETFEKLIWYLKFLESENKKYNLIGRNEFSNIWERHVFDSIQLYRFLSEFPRSVVDIGSGAGFPGVVLNILFNNKITLVESNKKKACFLENVSRETGVEFNVISERIESLAQGSFFLGVSRAVSSIKKMLEWTEGVCENLLLLKGEKYQEEIDDAQHFFDFFWESHESQTSEKSRIIFIKNFQKKLETH